MKVEKTTKVEEKEVITVVKTETPVYKVELSQEELDFLVGMTGPCGCYDFVKKHQNTYANINQKLYNGLYEHATDSNLDVWATPKKVVRTRKS